MTYTQVLNRSLELLDEEGPEAAYRFIKEEGFITLPIVLRRCAEKQRKLWDCSRKRCIPRDTGMIITT